MSPKIQSVFKYEVEKQVHITINKPVNILGII